MSFLAKLAELKKPGEHFQGAKSVKTSAHGEVKNNHKVQARSTNNETSTLPSNYVRQEDPAVKRLKELRRKEKMKLAAKSGKKIPAPSSDRKRKKEEHSMNNTDTKFRRKIGDFNRNARPMQPVQRAPIKKLSFEELMKQADERAKAVSQPNASASDGLLDRGKPKIRPVKLDYAKRSGSVKKKNSMPLQRYQSEKTAASTRPHISVPSPSIAQPNAKLRKKLDTLKKTRQAKHEVYDEEDDMDDFIEDDEQEPEYNRDEIWAMFNKGRKRRDFESDDESDMEANEMEILEEEEQASRMARLEDKKEEQWLKRHEEKKRKKFGRS
ncbi:LAFA_0E06546g1_1 [Lachancea sp. 'fantastica']|nr:LAFA_0E06546g1_1 [Lachancea sp. 'fantastica']